MSTWQTIVGGDGVTFPPKGARVRVEPCMVAKPVALAGVQLKFGLDRVEGVEGVLEHLYGLGADRSRPDGIELHVRTDAGALEVVALTFGDALRHVLVER